MKRLLLSASALLLTASPLVSLTAAAQEGRGDQARSEDRHDDRRDDRRGGEQKDQRQERWDESRHNGYYQGKTWHAGPPPEDAYSRPGFSLAYKPWSRGDKLGYYATRYQEVDYRDAHLRRPQRGYHWVRDDRGNYLMAAIATGLIASVIAASH